MKRLSGFLFMGVLLFIPGVVYANGVSPIINFFHKDTWMPASVVTLVIILFESVFLRWRIKNVHYVWTLWRCLMLNVASSVIGSVVLIVCSRDSFFMWDTMLLVLPLFLLTLATEIPLLRVLYHSVGVSWRRAIKLGFLMNIFSYLMVFVVEIGLLFALFSFTDHRDRKQLKAWTNPGLLAQATGVIYTAESDEQGSVVLRAFNPENRQWITYENCSSSYLDLWDIKGKTFVYREIEDGDTCIFIDELSAFTNNIEIRMPKAEVGSNGRWGKVNDLALSPDEKRLAILFKKSEVVSRKDSNSYYRLGDRCGLVVVDIATGQEVLKTPRWASDRGLCWSGDSRKVLFSSFDDESLYLLNKASVGDYASYEHGVNLTDGPFKQGLYALDVESGDVVRFADGCNPSLAIETGDILVQKGRNSLVLLNSVGKIEEQIKIDDVDVDAAVVSPSASMILVKIQRQNFFYSFRYIIISRTHPEVRHVLSDRHSYKLEWTTCWE